jgi:hypothetical protein
MKCSFCEQPLVCKSCRAPYKPRSSEAHVAVFQPDMEILCPTCQEILSCQACGYVYGATDEEEKDG